MEKGNEKEVLFTSKQVEALIERRLESTYALRKKYDDLLRAYKKLKKETSSDNTAGIIRERILDQEKPKKSFMSIDEIESRVKEAEEINQGSYYTYTPEDEPPEMVWLGGYNERDDINDEAKRMHHANGNSRVFRDNPAKGVSPHSQALPKIDDFFYLQDANEKETEKTPGKSVRKQKKGTGKIWGILLSIAVYAFCLSILAGAVGFAFSRNPKKSLFGYRVYNVLTMSMTPGKDSLPGGFRVGDMIVVKNARPQNIKEGDIVTLQTSPDSDSFLTHRVVEILDEMEGQKGLWFVTKGDANDANDPPVPADLLVGKKVMTIPKLGSLLKKIKENPIPHAIFAAALVGLILSLKYAFAAGRKIKDPKAGSESKRVVGVKAFVLTIIGVALALLLGLEAKAMQNALPQGMLIGDSNGIRVSYDGDYFIDAKNLRPGEVITKELIVRNMEDEGTYTLSLLAQPIGSSGPQDLLEKVNLTLKVDGDEVYKGRIKGDEGINIIENPLPLGEYPAGKSRTILITLTVDSDLLITYDKSEAEIGWQFYAVKKENEGGNGKNGGIGGKGVKTGDLADGIMLLLSAFWMALMSLMLIIWKRRKDRPVCPYAKLHEGSFKNRLVPR
ncbi:MAG: signal peptidase I [Lachnospiraceae bacterium]|nr:signal peptidase I [Lachnospiraceae bacterium]